MVNTTLASDTQAYLAWERFMKDSAGRWTADPIHTRGESVLLFRGFAHGEGDDGSGVFIRVDGKVIEAGSYEGAFPHIGEALFVTHWTNTSPSHEEAMDIVRRHTGARI